MPRDKMTGTVGDFVFNPPPRDLLGLATTLPNGDLIVRNSIDDEGTVFRKGKRAHKRYTAWLKEAEVVPAPEGDKAFVGIPAETLFIFLEEATNGLKPAQSRVQPMTPQLRRAFAQTMRVVTEARRKKLTIEIPDY